MKELFKEIGMGIVGPFLMIALFVGIAYVLPFIIGSKLAGTSMETTVIRKGEKKDVFDIKLAFFFSTIFWGFVLLLKYQLTLPDY